MQNSILVALLREETSSSYLVSERQLTLRCARVKGDAPNFSLAGSRENFHVASSRKKLDRNWIRNSLGEGRLNFRHHVVPSARRQKSYVRRKIEPRGKNNSGRVAALPRTGTRSEFAFVSRKCDPPPPLPPPRFPNRSYR